jgi:hypothetical protein
MNQLTDNSDGTIYTGRKGLAYDWQSLYAASQINRLEHDLVRLTPEYAE